MKTVQSRNFSRSQLQLLQQAKRQVRREFGLNLLLQSPDVLDQLYGLALNSKDSVLSDLHRELTRAPLLESEVSRPFKRKSVKPAKETKVGDIVDGRECVGLYRGQPVFRNQPKDTRMS